MLYLSPFTRTEYSLTRALVLTYFTPYSKLDRKQVKEVVCTECDFKQPSSAECVKCGVRFGAYYCLICNLFDDDKSKKIWHCSKCGICRVGGQENFYHCDQCDGCYPLSLKGKHKCLTKAMHSDCPICLDSVFDSTRSAVVLENCGHTLHTDCFTSHINGVYSARSKCPLCLVSLVSQKNSREVDDWNTEDEFEEVT